MNARTPISRAGLGLALLLLTTSAYAFDLKGVEVGAAANRAQLKTQLDVTCSTAAEVARSFPTGCYYAGAASLISGSHPQVSATLMDDDTLGELGVLFTPYTFPDYLAELTAKFGAPVEGERFTLGNAYGAVLPVMVAHWRNAAGDLITLSSLGLLQIQSAPRLAQLAAVKARSGL